MRSAHPRGARARRSPVLGTALWANPEIAGANGGQRGAGAVIAHFVSLVSVAAGDGLVTDSHVQAAHYNFTGARVIRVTIVATVRGRVVT